MINIISITILSLASAVLYRLGGLGYPYNTKIRDMGVPLCGMALFAVVGRSWFVWSGADIGLALLTFGLAFGAMTTYFKNGPTSKWYNWAFVGLAFGLCALPLAFATQRWLGFYIRTGVLVLGVTVWSEAIWQAWLEEGGRGLLFTATTPLLLIG